MTIRHTTPFQAVDLRMDDIDSMVPYDKPLYPGFVAEQDNAAYVLAYFERSTVERILKDAEKDGFVWAYDAMADKFLIRWLEDGPSDYDWYGADLITVGGTLKRVYAIGAYTWLWSIDTQKQEA